MNTADFRSELTPNGQIAVPPEIAARVPPGEPVPWTEAMVDLATNPARRHQLGEQARADAQQRFSVEEMADRTVAVYQEVLGRKIDSGPRHGSGVAEGSEVTTSE